MSEFEKCLKSKKIWKQAGAENFVSGEIKQAKTDLLSAQNSLKEGNNKWATIQAYYSMFHSARALIYSLGYRERNHACLIRALRELYVKPGDLELRLVESLAFGKTIRENADYYGDFSKETSETLINSAIDLLSVAKHKVRK
jgi:uncharacterized protein (UPF0332 family)